MDEEEYLPKNLNKKNQKIIYNTIKQDILNLENIKNKFNNLIKRNHMMNPKLFTKKELTHISKKNNNKNIPLHVKKSKYNNCSFEILEKKVYKKFFELYRTNEDFYNIKIINEIISNDSSHIVAEFKDFLIKDDYSEFILRYYIKEDSLLLLKQIFEYYKLSSVVYPNYILLGENKYIYTNIQKKQKIIDEQQEQEEKNIIEEQNKMNWTERNKTLDKSEKVFDSKIIDSILNQSNTSQIQKLIFGVSTETSYDFEENNNIFNLVKNINKAEEKSYIKFIEKNRLMNNFIKYNKNKFNNIIKNHISYNKCNIKEDQNIVNNQAKKNTNKTKNYINNNGHKIRTRNIQNKNLSIFAKTHSNLIPNFDNIKHVNKARNNIFSLYMNKKNENHNLKMNNPNKNKASVNKNCITNKSINSINENIQNNLTSSRSRNMKRKRNKLNLLDSTGNSEVKTFENYLKCDLKPKNKNLINTDYNNKSEMKSKIVHTKERSNISANSIKSLIQMEKLKLPVQKLEISKKKNNKKNNKFIKKAIIKELLSSIGTSLKETWRNSKLTESPRDLSHSNNKTDRGRKSIKNLIDKNINNHKKLNNNRYSSEIIGDNYKYRNHTTRIINKGKSRKQISLDVYLINNNRKNNNFININEQNIISNTLDSNCKNDSNIDINLMNERNTIDICKKEGHCRFLSKKNINSKINSSNFKERNIDKDIRKENRFNSINNKEKIVKNKKVIINRNNNIHNHYSQINNKNRHISSRNNRNFSNFCNKNLTYAMVNMKKLINNNQINNNKDTLTSFPRTLKDKLKLNFDFLKQNQMNQTEICNKKSEPTNDIYLTTKNSKNINFNKEINDNINNNINLNNNFNNNQNADINKQKENELYPLSSRDNNIITNKNYNCVLKNRKKFNNKTLKDPLKENRIGNFFFGYSNSYKNKNKYIKKIQNTSENNRNLILLNLANKKNEEKNSLKKKNSTISEVDSRQKKRRKISSFIYPNSNGIKTDFNSTLVNLNSSLNNFDNPNNKTYIAQNIKENNNINDTTTTINFNYEEKNKTNKLMNSPNIKKKASKKYNNSNKKNFDNEIITNKNLINNNTRYYNIEVNINNDFNDSNYNDHKEKIIINKVNKNSKKKHIKLNSITQLSTGSLNINFNNITNNYCINCNNNSVVSTNQNKTKYPKIEPKKYKRIKNIKNNIKGIQINEFDNILLNKNKNNNNNNFHPLTLTERTRQVQNFSPINSYSSNVENENKK